ncbi:MAG: PEP-CTERM system histidine kinase PrsK [Burkholderiales bacterium]|nr:PEP-CTERM system histidine kinase PrsK [Burkholderiales bacterium]
MSLPIGTFSYSASGAAFLLVFLLLVSSWRGRLQGALLATACLIMAIWSAGAAYWALNPERSALFVEAAEIVRSAAWFCFLIVLLGYSHKATRSLRTAAVALALFCAAVLAGTIYSSGPRVSDLRTYEILARLLLSVVGMVLVEQLYREVSPKQRWGIKFLCLALGGIFVCDFYLYADALLFRRVSMDIWAARGVVDALAVPLIAISASRNPTWSLDITVSRRIVFHSTAILGAAVYLLGMAAAGYYIRFFGGTWGVVLQVTFLFGALQLLVIIFASGTLRARLKVFLSKNFFSYRYDYREEWLRFTRTLSEGEPGAELHERSIQAIADLVESPGGILLLRQDSGAFDEVATWNMPRRSLAEPGGNSLCRFLEEHQWVIELEECIASPDVYPGLTLPGWLRDTPAAWLVVPLMLHEGLLGFVVLTRSKGKIRLDWEVHDILKTAGRQAASYLAQLEAAKALLVARQFESFNRMSAFVVHDLKNLVAQLSLLLTNSEKHRHTPEFQRDMIETVSNSVDKMKRLLFQLRGGYSLTPAAPVALNDLLRAAVRARSASSPAPRFDESDAQAAVLAHRPRLERVVGHLVQNAIEATPADGRVVASLSRRDGQAVIEIADSGCGMSESFIRERLFKPFESTKSAGMGIGTYEVQQYVREIGGRIEVESVEGRGTIFRLLLPVHEDDSTSSARVAAEGRA